MIPQYMSYALADRVIEIIGRCLGPESKIISRNPADSLRTTFLLSMAMPLLIIPYERLLVPYERSLVEPEDGRNGNFSKLFRAEFNENKLFKDVDLLGQFTWYQKVLNGGPHSQTELFDRIQDPANIRVAQQEKSYYFIRGLRNALAHGNVTYLDKDGLYRPRETASGMLAFVTYDCHRKKIKRTFVRAISEEDFLNFLKSWANWIEEIGYSVAGSDTFSLSCREAAE